MFSWGEMTVVVTSASIPSFLDAINSSDILINEVTFVDDLNIRLKIRILDYQKIRNIAQKRGDELHLLDRSGILYFLSYLLKRPVIILSFVIWMFFLLYLPGRILFFRVDGNQRVSDYDILSAAQQCGVSFGASRRNIKSEKVKNALLSQLPELKWVGVNTKGCVVTISVKEGEIPDRTREEQSFSNVIATIDGVVTDITVISGNPLCKVGQAVRKGQILVSGYTDCGLHIKSGHADAEIIGITRRNISAVAIYPNADRKEIKTINTNYGIQVGKNMIKLKKYSGILDACCVKMYDKKILTLPGGFCLPVSFIKETVIEYISEENTGDEEKTCDWVEEKVQKICSSNMVAGQILYTMTKEKQNECEYHYSGYYICKEIIGKVCTEELFESNGKRNS